MTIMAVAAGATDMAGTDRKLLEILVCPVSHVPLRYDSLAQELVSDQSALAYPIRGGIPVMIAAEARPLRPGEEKK